MAYKLLSNCKSVSKRLLVDHWQQKLIVKDKETITYCLSEGLYSHTTLNKTNKKTNERH